MSTKEWLLALAGAQVCQRKIDGDLVRNLTAEAKEALYGAAEEQDLAHIVAEALAKQGDLGTDPISEKFKKASMKAMYRYVRMNCEFEKICQTLEAAKIPFIPLKGAVLRAYYPAPWMRTSCDIDILVKEETLDTALAVLQETLAYTSDPKSDHDVSLYSESGVHLELHFDTIQERYESGCCRQVLQRIWEDATPITEGASHHRMSDAMFYFYHIAHMAKHFQTGGCGIRSFLDQWILDNQVTHDDQERDRLLEEGKLLCFTQAVRKLADAWFGGGEMDERTRQVGDYILRAGLFGNHENRAALGQAQMDGRLRYLLTRRVFLPYDYLKAEYPILKKHKWLFPVYQVVRWLQMLCNGNAVRSLRELKANTSVSDEKVRETKKMLEYLQL